MLTLALLFACSSAPEPAVEASVPAALLPSLVIDADQSVAVIGSQIVGVGGDIDMGAMDPAIVLKADLVTSGFVDAHAHPTGLGRLQSELQLADSPSYADTLQRIRDHKAEGWVTGRGWDQNDWADAPQGKWPLAKDLDAIHPETPVALRRIDGHAVWVNTAVLKLAGITDDTPDPEGGRIIRDGDGHATGVLVDNAGDLVDRPESTDAELELWVRKGMQGSAAAGLTGVHMMGCSDRTLAIYERLGNAGEVPIRLWIYVNPGSEAAAKLGTTGPWTAGSNVKIVGVKAYIDGALGSRGALLRQEYSDEAGQLGNRISTTDELVAIGLPLVAQGAQLAVHAIGDGGVHDTLNAFEKLRAEPSDVRLRVEHAQVVSPEDFPRFKALNVVASMQPTHGTSDMPWAEQRVGAERIKGAYAWRTMLDSGAILAFGSDFPVEHEQPALGMWSATTRADADGKPAGGWYPGQLLTQDEAVAAFTVGAAMAVHEEDRLGLMQEGRVADLTLWNLDKTPAGTRYTAVATVVEGEVVWKASSTTIPQ